MNRPFPEVENSNLNPGSDHPQATKEFVAQNTTAGESPDEDSPSPATFSHTSSDQAQPEEAAHNIPLAAAYSLEPVIESNFPPQGVANRPRQLLSHAQWLQVYLAGAIFCNFFFLFFNGYSGDLGFWHNWIGQLSQQGYDNFRGDYPPVYLHWLYMVGKIILAANIPLEVNDFLKFLVQFPILLCHCAFILIVHSLLKQSHAKNAQYHSVMLLAAFNPALYFDGPVWGQVDMLPVTFALGAILLCFNRRWGVLALPLYMIALLTKFQMICFAPVFAILFFARPRTHLLGVLLSVGTFILGFLPFILTGNFLTAFKQAYINTLGQYPVTTYNAANIWMLLTGNSAPDSTLLIAPGADQLVAKLFMAKHLGMAIFALFCLGLFLQGSIRIFKYKYRYELKFKAYSIQAAMFCAIAFFTLLPAMHERYLFPAVVCSLAYVALTKSRFFYPVVLTLICWFNMAIILGINGSDLWQGLSWLMVAIFALAFMESLLGEKLHDRIVSLSFTLAKQRYLALTVLILATSGMFTYLYNRYHLNDLTLAHNQILLTKLTPISAHQDHGSLNINRSFDKNILSIGNRRYANGLGTHANSVIRYQLPSNAKTFSFMVGLDDEIGQADVRFSVVADGKGIWHSDVIYGFEKNQKPITLDVSQVKLLQLHVNSMGKDAWDHADWINPVLTLDMPEQARQ